MVLLEDPTPALVVGILAAVVCGVALLRTTRGIYLLALAGVVLATLAFVGLEWLVVTEVERVETTIEAGATALEADDLDLALGLCAPEAEDVRQAARRTLAVVRFTKVKITDLKVSINRLTSPPTATAELTVLVSGRPRRGGFEEMSRPFGVRLFLQSRDGRWLVTDYEVEERPLLHF